MNAATKKTGGGVRRQIALLVLALVAFAVAMGSFYFIQTTTQRNQAWLDLVKQMQADVLELAKVGEDAARGAEPDFGTLLSLEETFSDTVRVLREGDPGVGLKPFPGSLNEQITAVEQAWEQMKKAVDAVLAAEEQYAATASNIAIINDAIPGLIATYEQIAERLASRGAPGSLISIAAGQLIRLERMQTSASRVIALGRDAETTAKELETHAREYMRANRALVEALGDGAEMTRQAGSDFEPVLTASSQILEVAPVITQLQLASATLQGEGANVLATTKNLEQGLFDYSQGTIVKPWMIYVAGAIGILLLTAFIVVFLAGLQRRISEAADRDARQQKAILDLLDEITNLADGDLTVDVTVTEDFTGAIADSINYTVGNMRQLVGSINSAAIEIAAAASSTQDTARQMNAASERQAREITAAAGTVTASSQELQQVAMRAEDLASQAATSVQVAHNGADTVGRTIQSMAMLREQIQDTAKRIKRLGESSQEIGNIIEFINDIAEQTNTLALNASIQAAMAGEQGRGFAVVADEVQRLAERAGNATKQIETLVKTIQADTQEAITSMERSTANVVAGAKSAEEAGQALTKIESTSQDLARLIQDIAVQARTQSAQATKIAGTMQVMRDIAVQTSGSAAQTAEAVGELNTLSEKLRQSVSGFKLPIEIAA